MMHFHCKQFFALSLLLITLPSYAGDMSGVDTSNPSHNPAIGSGVTTRPSETIVVVPPSTDRNMAPNPDGTYGTPNNPMNPDYHPSSGVNR